MGTDRVSVKEAAAELNMTPECVRFLMREGRIDLGHAMHAKGAKRWYYIIFRGLLDAEKERIANGKCDWNPETKEKEDQNGK